MKFDIDGVIVDNIDQHSDERGFLIETFRIDDEFFNSIYRLKDGTYTGCPMTYISATVAGQVRGPHEHKEQTDVFCFLGSSKFEIRLWDNRPDSNTYKKEMKIIAEDSAPLIVVVPPGVVHGYKNIGPDYPLHFSRFSPMYKLTHLPPTPTTTLEKARKIALDAGMKYVYIGNVPLHNANSTYCPKCGKILIERKGYQIKQNNLVNSTCKFCGESVKGVWF